MEAVRAERALSEPDDPKHPDSGTVREILEALEARGLGHDPRLDSVKVPKGFEYLWRMFWDVRQGATQGFSGAFLTWADVEAYQRVSGARLDAFELDAIMAMDGALKAPKE